MPKFKIRWEPTGWDVINTERLRTKYTVSELEITVPVILESEVEYGYLYCEGEIFFQGNKAYIGEETIDPSSRFYQNSTT